MTTNISVLTCSLLSDTLPSNAPTFILHGDSLHRHGWLPRGLVFLINSVMVNL